MIIYLELNNQKKDKNWIRFDLIIYQISLKVRK